MVNKDLIRIITTQLTEIGERIEQFAGVEVREKVMEGSDAELDRVSPVQGALGMKAAIDRLDKLTDKTTREKIMTACGYHCQAKTDPLAKKYQEERQKYSSEEEFLTNLHTIDSPNRYEYNGDYLVQYHQPRKAHGMRCSCFIMAALPDDVNASTTYCLCSRAFIEKRWETILERQVRVEINKTAITGSNICKFTIYLD